jgi:hypothetical protein
MFDKKISDYNYLEERFLNRSTGKMEEDFYDLLEEMFLKGSFDLTKLTDKIGRYSS